MTRNLIALARRTSTPIYLAPQGTPSNLEATVYRWPVFLVERKPVHRALRVRVLRNRRVAVDLIDRGAELLIVEGEPRHVALVLDTINDL